jgi:hypothetical protein
MIQREGYEMKHTNQRPYDVLAEYSPRGSRSEGSALIPSSYEKEGAETSRCTCSRYSKQRHIYGAAFPPDIFPLLTRFALTSSSIALHFFRCKHGHCTTDI